VPILPDDTAGQVFDKVTVAAEPTLWRALPALVAGDAPRLPNDLAAGSYYGGRKPEDGRIDWTRPAQQVYNLVRAVAPPYPGAFTDIGGERFIVAAARLAKPGAFAPGAAQDPGASQRRASATVASQAAASSAKLPLGLQVCDNALFGVCGDGRALAIRELRQVRRDSAGNPAGERVIDAATFVRLTQSSRHP
jgi:methionyl-tRNA formyltransferase